MDTDAEWMKVREAALLSGLSVQRIYQIAYEEEGPFVTRTIQIRPGRTRTELRIWRPSFDQFMRSRTASTEESWGRELVGPPA